MIKLIGTPKQIAWAEKIRAKAIQSKNNTEIPKKVLDIVISKNVFKKIFLDIKKSFEEKNLSKFWIDNRELEHFLNDYVLRETIIAYSEKYKDKPNGGWIKKEKD